jgi:hypothetical protein
LIWASNPPVRPEVAGDTAFLSPEELLKKAEEQIHRGLKPAQNDKK